MSWKDSCNATGAQETPLILARLLAAQPGVKRGALRELALTRAIVYSDRVLILKNAGGIALTNSFLLADEATRQAVIFDAPDHTTEPLLGEAAKRELQIIGLWLTHGHFDHFADHPMVRQHAPAVQVLIHALDEPKARHPDMQTRLFGLPLRIPPLKPDGHVSDGQHLKLGNLEAVVLHTPGHSPGHVAYYFPSEAVIVGGDLIIGGSVGRTDLPDSDHAQLEASVRRVMALPPATRLLAGHGEITTLAEERRQNYFVQDILASSSGQKMPND